MSPVHENIVATIQGYEVDDRTKDAAIGWVNVIFFAKGNAANIAVSSVDSKICLTVVGRTETVKIVVEPN